MKLAADTIWLATAAVDMRTGIDGLSLHVQQDLGRPPCDGTACARAHTSCERACNRRGRITFHGVVLPLTATENTHG